MLDVEEEVVEEIFAEPSENDDCDSEVINLVPVEHSESNLSEVLQSKF
jgi:hypothetical protein